MTKSMTLNVRLSGALGDFVSANVGGDGAYENVSEYVRDLIRRDKARAEGEAFDRLKAELARAFAAEDSDYHSLAAEDIIARNPLDHRE
jgi:Arc/MetJ-type ribon-helix-helix transcriptional regulator